MVCVSEVKQCLKRESLLEKSGLVAGTLTEDTEGNVTSIFKLQSLNEIFLHKSALPSSDKDLRASYRRLQ